MKKILIVETGAGFGGALTSLESLLSGVDPRRFEVHLISSYAQDLIRTVGAVRSASVVPRTRRYGPDAVLEARLRPLLGGRAGNAAFAVDHLTTGRHFADTVRRYAEDNAIDLIHGNNGVLINDAVVLAAGRAGVPCVVHARAPEFPSRITAWLAKDVDRVLAVSRFVAQSVWDLDYPAERIVIAPEGLDADAFAAQADPQRFRKRHALPPDIPLVGLVGCLVPWKGHDVFLDACGLALGHGSAMAVVVGAEPDRSGRRMAALRARAQELGLGDRVRFTGHESDVASAMAACEVVVHASTCPEPFGRVLLEAMALGRPVIATRAGGPGEIIDPGRDGLLVAPGDAHEMALAIELLLGNQTLRHKIGQAGRRTVRHRYGVARHVAIVEAVWGELTAG